MKNPLDKLTTIIAEAITDDGFIFKKVVPVKTPFIYGDSGLHIISDDKVSFPLKKLREAIIEEITVKLKTKLDLTSSEFDLYKAISITIDGNCWLVANERDYTDDSGLAYASGKTSP